MSDAIVSSQPMFNSMIPTYGEPVPGRLPPRTAFGYANLPTVRRGGTQDRKFYKMRVDNWRSNHPTEFTNTTNISEETWIFKDDFQQYEIFCTATQHILTVIATKKDGVNFKFDNLPIGTSFRFYEGLRS